MLIFVLCFILSFIFGLLSLLGRIKMDLGNSCLFLSNTSQHMLACAKIISSWVRVAVSIAMAHTSMGTVQDAASCVTLAAVICLLSIM